jgi:hypothetical protein
MEVYSFVLEVVLVLGKKRPKPIKGTNYGGSLIASKYMVPN